jgi:hypothetical protein
VGHVVVMGIQVFNRTDDHVIGMRDKPSSSLRRLPGNDHAQQNEQGTSPHGYCPSYKKKADSVWAVGRKVKPFLATSIAAVG